MADDGAGVSGPIQICGTLQLKWLFLFCFFDVLQHVVNGDGEFAGTGMAVDAVVVPFDNVGKGGNAEVIRFLF